MESSKSPEVMNLKERTLTLDDVNKIRNRIFKEICKDVYGSPPNYNLEKEERNRKHKLYQQRIRRVKSIPMFIKIDGEEIQRLILYGRK